MNALTDLRDWLDGQLHVAQHAIGLSDGTTFHHVIADAFARARSLNILRPLLPLPTAGKADAAEAVADLSKLHYWVSMAVNDREDLRNEWAASKPTSFSELSLALVAAEEQHSDYRFLIAAYDTENSVYTISNDTPDPARLLDGLTTQGGSIDVCARMTTGRIWRFVAIRHPDLKAEDACDQFKCLARSAGTLLPPTRMSELGVATTLDPMANWLAYLLLGNVTRVEVVGQHRAIKHPYAGSIAAAITETKRASTASHAVDVAVGSNQSPPSKPILVSVVFRDETVVAHLRSVIAVIRSYLDDPRMKRAEGAFGLQDVVTDAGRALLAAKRWGALDGDVELFERIESIVSGEREYQQSQEDRGFVPRPVPWQVWVAAVRLLWNRAGQPYGQQEFSKREILEGCPVVADYLEDVIVRSTVSRSQIEVPDASDVIELKAPKLPKLKPWAMEAWVARQAGSTVTEIAALLSKKHKNPKITQPRVTEQIRLAQLHAEASGLAGIAAAVITKSDGVAPARTIDPTATDLGERTDRRSKHLRDKAKQIADEE